MKKVHDWRLCPEGCHYVRAHDRTTPNGKVCRVTAHCARNPKRAKKIDKLTADEILEMSKTRFENLKNLPCPSDLGFKDKGDRYDKLIAGWTQYWNEVMLPDEPLESNLVKALIASESGFKSTSKHKSGAIGLMQLLEPTRKILGDIEGELKNNFVSLSKKDLTNPTMNICAGIRWMFRKRQIVKNKNSKASWIDVVMAYKAYTDPNAEGMIAFNDYLLSLKECK